MNFEALLLCYLLYKEQVVLYLPSELDRRHLSPSPSTEGYVVIVDVPVATLNLKANHTDFQPFRCPKVTDSPRFSQIPKTGYELET